MRPQPSIETVEDLGIESLFLHATIVCAQQQFACRCSPAAVRSTHPHFDMKESELLLLDAKAYGVASRFEKVTEHIVNIDACLAIDKDDGGAIV